jgi:hypothetical protein
VRLSFLYRVNSDNAEVRNVEAVLGRHATKRYGFPFAARCFVCCDSLRTPCSVPKLRCRIVLTGFLTNLRIFSSSTGGSALCQMLLNTVLQADPPRPVVLMQHTMSRTACTLLEEIVELIHTQIADASRLARDPSPG